MGGVLMSRPRSPVTGGNPPCRWYRHFDGIESLLASVPADRLRTSPAWRAIDPERSTRLAIEGDTSPDSVAAFERGRKIANDTLGELSVASSDWALDYAGAIPSVPHYLAGCDRTMRRRVESASVHSPVRVFASTMTQWSYSLAQVAERAGIMAGAIALLAERRPVELVLCFGCGSKAPVMASWNQPTRDASIVLAQFAQTRGSIYKAVGVHNMDNGGSESDVSPFFGNPRANRVRFIADVLGIGPDDIYIGEWLPGEPAEKCLDGFRATLAAMADE